MNSRKDKKQIVSYFCILFLLCGVRTISCVCCDETISDRLQSYNLEAKEGYPDNQHYMTDDPLINNGATVRHALYRNQYPNAISASDYCNEVAYYGYSSIALGAVVISVILTILAARHLLC